MKWTVKICAFIAHRWKQEEPRASQIDSFQSEQMHACMLFSVELSHRFFTHFFTWETLLCISNMFISLCKKYIFIFSRR